MRDKGVYVKFVEDFETDKEILRNFVKKYSRDVEHDLDYVDKKLDEEELYADDYVVCAYVDDSDDEFWFGDEDDYWYIYQDVTNECKKHKKILGEL